MIWEPFDHPDMISVEITKAEDIASQKYTVKFVVLRSRVGDLARFCYLVGSNILWVSGPIDDEGIPVYPGVTDEGYTRTDRIEITTDSLAVIEETVSGVLNDLDEYIRSKKALENLVDAEEITI